MKLAMAIRVLPVLSLCLSIRATLAVSFSRIDCQETCGNVSIPYPFGIGAKCSANSSFTVICSTSIDPPKPFLRSLNLEVTHISLFGAVIVTLPVSPTNCSNGTRTQLLSMPSLKGSPFTISSEYNSLVVMGCKTSLWLRNASAVRGCMPLCDAKSTDTTCNGVNCCQTTIPSRMQELQFTYQTFQENVNYSGFCGYAFPVDIKWMQSLEGYQKYKGLISNLSNPFDPDFRSAPLVLEWEFETAPNPHEHHFACRDHHDHSDYGSKDYASSIRNCWCLPGYEGSPYSPEGCSDINECDQASMNNCSNHMTTCVNTNGSFFCRYGVSYHDHDDRFRADIKISSITIGSFVGVILLLVAAWKFGKAVKEAVKAIKASRKQMFFNRNGGVLLEQQLTFIECELEKTRLFSSVELAKATDDYSESRILGRGGEGVVYKGMLEDGTIVAVKKSERVNQGGDVQDFINEVVIVSQINHRNVVKLLGCCLESEVPRLVYEFIPNGTLFSHIHYPHEDFPLFWELRVRIAKQVAGALAYLHSAACVPIYHRDIKSTNILLDEKYRAKISDFGTSRSISIDQTHVTTRVVGTFGYLDPEYFQSNQFTEKSDVYSFGVVLVELLTGEKAVSAVRVEEGRGLAMHFLHSMEENQLLGILDARVVREGDVEDIEAMAQVARRCLQLNGKNRPTMREVSRDLEAIRAVEKLKELDFSQNLQIDESSGCDSTDDVDSDSYSYILETIPVDECCNQ